MSVELNTPVVVPAVPEQTFPTMWLSELHINCKDGKTCKIAATIVPASMNADGSATLNTAAAQRWCSQNLFADMNAQEQGVMLELLVAIKSRLGV